MTKEAAKPSAVRTRRAIVNSLKQEGPMDSQSLAARLGVSAMAIRQHLYALRDECLVTYVEEMRAMGRPAKLWQLTPAADRLFPSGYAELTLGLLQSIVEACGEAGLERLLAIRTRDQIAAYQTKVPTQESLPQKLAALAEIRTAEGYMAQTQVSEAGDLLLIENHCPICAAATACPGFCRQELEVFQAVLGAVKIERIEHIVVGARRCAYRISELSA